MNQKRMKAGIAGDDFPSRARCGIPLEGAGYVFANSGKHRFFLEICPQLS
jgi:hypothetical protein